MARMMDYLPFPSILGMQMAIQLLYLLTIISIAMLDGRFTLRRRSTPNQES